MNKNEKVLVKTPRGKYQWAYENGRTGEYLEVETCPKSVVETKNKEGKKFLNKILSIGEFPFGITGPKDPDGLSPILRVERRMGVKYEVSFKNDEGKIIKEEKVIQKKFCTVKDGEWVKIGPACFQVGKPYPCPPKKDKK